MKLNNLHITYPHQDLVIHTKDVKSAFCQIKFASDIIEAFSFIIAYRLFIPRDLTFGTDFRPASWEVIQQVLEGMAQWLFEDGTLIDKHAKYLDQLSFGRSLGKSKRVSLTYLPVPFQMDSTITFWIQAESPSPLKKNTMLMMAYILRSSARIAAIAQLQTVLKPSLSYWGQQPHQVPGPSII